MAPSTLYILYNANSTILGKLTYSYRHITCSKSSDPACAACDITHGGLHLNESEAWKGAKREIEEQGGLEVKQQHKDELTDDLRKWIESKGLAYPLVLLRKEGAEGYETVISSGELAKLKGDPARLVEELREKGVLSTTG